MTTKAQTYEARMLEEHRKRLARYERLARTYAEKVRIEKHHISLYEVAVAQQAVGK